MMATDAAAALASQPVRLDEGTLAEALAVIDQALVLTRRKATRAGRARLVAMAYRVLVEEQKVSTAVERIMQLVAAADTGDITQGEPE